MRPMQTRGGRLAMVLAIAALAGCENELPTVTGEGGFPADRVPLTLEVTVPAGEFLVSDTVYDQFDSPLDYLLVANDFDDALDSHALVRFTGFPDSVVYSTGGASRTDHDFVYGSAEVVALVDSASSHPIAPLELELLPLTQPWDSITVSWENAVEGAGAVVPWTTAGGTTGPVAARATWDPGSTTQRDTLRWTVDSLTVERLAGGDLHGVLVRPAAPGARLELSAFSIRLRIRPEGRPDTVLTQSVSTGPKTFIFTPDPPAVASGVLAVGGLTGARSVLRLDLSREVPTCAPGVTGPSCRQVPLREVTIDQAVLLLDPAPVPLGFRPVSPTILEARHLLEPELGRRATLGAVIGTDTVPAAGFLSGTGPGAGLNITGPVVAAVNSASPILDLALLKGLDVLDFGTAWFDTTPRLRLLYTVRTQPQLP